MCMIVYLASSKSLQPPPADAQKSSLYVVGISESESTVRTHFTKNHVYRIGAYEGCGCGFQYGREPFEDDHGHLAKANQSRRALLELVNKALEKQPEIELYACWDGDQHLPTESRAGMASLDLIQVASDSTNANF